MKKAFVVMLFLILPEIYLNAQSSWHHPLYISGGGYWQSRIPVEIFNTNNKELNGIPVSMPIGSGNNELDMAGELVTAIRVCDESVNEFLFDVIHDDGTLVRFL
ncbi:hypothetical protein FJZ33_02995 [Candidatus Poribacteria bacterium]|nr:hypothetical protein [Candidatus Poribacteria bacterium]